MVVATTGGSLRVVLATTGGSFWVVVVTTAGSFWVVVVTTAGSFWGRVDSFWEATVLGTFRGPVRAGGRTILLDGATGEVAPDVGMPNGSPAWAYPVPST